MKEVRQPRPQHLQPLSRSNKGSHMFSKFFIDRPVFAAVLSIFIMLAGLAAMRGLPIAQYPEIAPPVVQVRAVYPGASAEVIASTVAAPIENAINGVEDMMYMSSTSASSGVVEIMVTFEIGTDPDQAALNVNNRVKQAEPRLPAARAVVNPNRLDDASGQGVLAAVGVAFLLAVAVFLAGASVILFLKIRAALDREDKAIPAVGGGADGEGFDHGGGDAAANGIAANANFPRSVEAEPWLQFEAADDQDRFFRLSRLHGVPAEQFRSVFNSKEVDTKIRQAYFLARDYKLTGVPSLVINGKYLTSGTHAGSFESMLEVTDKLIEQERQE